MLRLQLLCKWRFSQHYHSPHFIPHTSKPKVSVSCNRALTNKVEVRMVRCSARRRVRYDENDEDDEGVEYGYNEEIAMLEAYTQSARGEALLVRAEVDGQEELVLVFKGFSSSLTYGTAADVSRSVLPARATIKWIDRVKGPFDPTNIECIEAGLTWDAFKARIPPNSTTP